MAVITIKVVVGNISGVLAVFDQIKIYRSVDGLTGTYVELTTPSTRIPMQSGTMVYEFRDTNGDAEYYYKVSYYNSTSGLESSKSDAQKGEGDPALDVISVSELKTNYLFGLDLTDDTGTEYPDSLYEWFIRSAVSWIEIRLDMPLRPKIIDEEKHDFVPEDYRNFMLLHLCEYPVIAVDEIKLVLPGSTEEQVFDSSWIQLRKDSGVVHIIPGTGGVSSILLGAGAAWVPWMRIYARFVPDAFRVKYTAGFERGQIPPVLKDLVGKVASFGPLNIAGDLLGGAGIASQAIGIDGLSQSFNTTSSATNAGYGARLLQYSKEVKTVLPTLQKYFKGIRMAVG